MISLYAKGMTTGDIQAHLLEIYGTEISHAKFRRASVIGATSRRSKPRSKVLYLVANQRRPNRTNLAGQTNGWKQILNALNVHYGDRIAANH